MIDLSNTDRRPRYEVRVGHVRVTVRSSSPADAIREARRLMSLDMPRLYDVIQRLDASRFQVILLESFRQNVSISSWRWRICEHCRVN